MVLGGDHGERIRLVAEFLEIGLSDARKNSGKTRRNARFFLAVTGAEQRVAHFRGCPCRHLFDADDQHVTTLPRLQEIAPGMNGGAARGAGVFGAAHRFEAQGRHRLQDQAGRKVLPRHAAVEHADEHRVDLLRRQTGIFDRRQRHVGNQRLGILVLMFAEGRMGPAHDDRIHLSLLPDFFSRPVSRIAHPARAVRS